MPDAVTMDKIVSLARRRGFVFPSSEIYGGLGSSYDYGHYGVLLKENVKARWLEAMVRERDDIVALDSSIILHPAVWEASGHVTGFADPLVDCRFCKRRYRADQIDRGRVRRAGRASTPARPTSATSPSRASSTSCSQTRIGPVEETGQDAYLRPETAQGIFINFKNVAQIARRKPPFGIAQIGKAFRNEITPGNFIFRTLEFEQMEMEYFVPPAEADEWFRFWVEERRAWHLRYGIRESHLRVREHDAEELSHYSSATSDLEYLFPMGWSELEGIAHRGDFDLTAHTEASGTKLEWVDGQERYTPHVVEPALGVNRSMLAFLVDAYDEEVVAERERTVLRLHPALAPVKVAVLPLIPRNEDMVGEGAVAVRGASAGRGRRVRRLGPDRPPVPAPGRDRHAVRAHDRRADARGRHGHDPRPRLARAGADPDLGGACVRAGQAGGGLEDAEAELALPAPALERLVARLRESELAVEVVRVGGVQEPLRLRERPFVDAEADELDAQAAAAVLLEHVDVREIGLHMAVGERPREADLIALVVEADDASGVLDQVVLNVARAPLRPVRLLAQVAMNRLAVDARRVVVELVAVSEARFTNLRQPVDNSYTLGALSASAEDTSRVRPGFLALRGPRRSRRSRGERAQAKAAVELVRRDDDREDVSHRPLPQPEPVCVRERRPEQREDAAEALGREHHGLGRGARGADGAARAREVADEPVRARRTRRSPRGVARSPRARAA